jgi:hypothetical protein
MEVFRCHKVFVVLTYADLLRGNQRVKVKSHLDNGITLRPH